MNIVGENNFVYLSRDRPNIFDFGFSDNSCHHFWRLSSMSLYIFVPSRSQYFFLITIFCSLCYFLAAMSPANNSELQTGNRSRREGDQQIGRRSAVQRYSFRTVQNAVQCTVSACCTGEYLIQVFYADQSYRSVSRCCAISLVSLLHIWTALH